ncbi:hypothetical protein GX48_00559 [Paracoccidioides brasiliensis]|nr:hypothetical protein GX48_00559 [Paracoccidioides brasiliensis]
MSPSAYPGLAVASWMDQAGLVGTVVGAATSLLKGRHVSHAGFVWRLDTTYSHPSWAMACLVLGRFAPACEVRSSGQEGSFPPDSCAAKISPPCRSEVAQNLHPSLPQTTADVWRPLCPHWVDGVYSLHTILRQRGVSCKGALDDMVGPTNVEAPR